MYSPEGGIRGRVNNQTKPLVILLSGFPESAYELRGSGTRPGKRKYLRRRRYFFGRDSFVTCTKCDNRRIDGTFFSTSFFVSSYLSVSPRSYARSKGCTGDICHFDSAFHLLE